MIHTIRLRATAFLLVGFIAACSPPQLNSEYRETPIPSEIILPIEPQNTSTLSYTTRPNTVTPTDADSSPIATQTSPPVTPSPETVRLTITPAVSVWWEKLLPGQYLLYWDYENNAIYATSYDGTHTVSLVTGVVGSGLFSADFTKLFYITRNDISGELMIEDLNDGTITSIPGTQGCHELSWSLDSKSIAASCNGEIWAFSLETDNRVLIAKGTDGELLYSPIWSPNGKWLAYFNRPTMHLRPEDGLYIADVTCIFSDVTCPINVTGPFVEDLNPPIYWSPDSQYLVTVLNTSISVLDFQKGEFRELVEINNSMYPEAVTWSPDGKYIAYDIFMDDIYVVDAWSGGIISRVDLTPFSFEILTWISIPHLYTPGNIYIITKDGANLNLRDSPSLGGKILKQLQPNDLVTVLDGLIRADGYTWWKLQAEDGTEGWAVNIPEWYGPVDQEINR